MIKKCILICLLATATIINAKKQPNIVRILADDLGWSDCELYGATNYFKTPNIMKLASRGVRFTQAYTSSPVCSPTRCSILAGQHPARTGIVHARCHLPEVRMTAEVKENMPADKKAKDILYVTRLDTTHFTLAEALKEEGYVTGHFGKWHLGLPPYDASNHGFDVVIPKHPEGAIKSGYLAPWKQLSDTTFKGEPGEHIEDRMAQEAVAFMRENKDKPFFLNYWAFSIHSPWSAKTELTEKYTKLADPFSPQRNPVYAAMVESFDDAVGTITDELDKLGITENTIIIFYSDNGGNTYAPPVTEPVGYEHIPGTHSHPLRAGKGSYYEGGTRVPAIISWPGVTVENTINHSIFSSVDIYPTVLDMLNIEQNENQFLDGTSFLPAVKGQQFETPVFGYRPLYVYSIKPAIWVRNGDWKLIRFFCDNEDQSDRLELYNLNWDIGETRDLVDRFPEKAKDLNHQLDSFIVATEAVIPVPNPEYKR